MKAKLLCIIFTLNLMNPLFANESLFFKDRDQFRSHGFWIGLFAAAGVALLWTAPMAGMLEECNNLAVDVFRNSVPPVADDSFPPLLCHTKIGQVQQVIPAGPYISFNCYPRGPICYSQVIQNDYNLAMKAFYENSFSVSWPVAVSLIAGGIIIPPILLITHDRYPRATEYFMIYWIPTTSIALYLTAGIALFLMSPTLGMIQEMNDPQINRARNAGSLTFWTNSNDQSMNPHASPQFMYRCSSQSDNYCWQSAFQTPAQIAYKDQTMGAFNVSLYIMAGTMLAGIPLPLVIFLAGVGGAELKQGLVGCVSATGGCASSCFSSISKSVKTMKLKAMADKGLVINGPLPQHRVAEPQPAPTGDPNRDIEEGIVSE